MAAIVASGMAAFCYVINSCLRWIDKRYSLILLKNNTLESP
jgi:hypothetical protein